MIEAKDIRTSTVMLILLGSDIERWYVTIETQTKTHNRPIGGCGNTFRYRTRNTTSRHWDTVKDIQPWPLRLWYCLPVSMQEDRIYPWKQDWPHVVVFITIMVLPVLMWPEQLHLAIEIYTKTRYRLLSSFGKIFQHRSRKISSSQRDTIKDINCDHRTCGTTLQYRGKKTASSHEAILVTCNRCCSIHCTTCWNVTRIIMSSHWGTTVDTQPSP